MAKLQLRDVRKSYGAVDVIKGVDLEIDDGEFMVFVGPSGCGKSTLLRLIAGLEDITSGDMLFDGQRVNDLAPSKRGIAMVFQSYALYPHMNVYDNMAFGMKLQKAGADDIKAAGREGGEDAADRPPARPPAEAALRRPAPARRHRPRGGPRPAGLPLRRAALQPRRRAPRRDPARDRQAPPRRCRTSRWSTSPTTRSRR